jgi:hypothetical protein
MKWVFLAVGGITVFSGLMLLLLPIPLGIPLLAVGVPILMRYSTRMRDLILSKARRFPKLHEFLSRIPTASDAATAEANMDDHDPRG